MTIQVSVYQAHHQDEWDNFVRESKNGTFLLERGFVEYHKDRFQDCSLMLRNPEGRLVAVLPATQRDSDLHSHLGLTYGGLVLSYRTGAAFAMEALDAVTHYMRDTGLNYLHYKTIPWIYHRHPAEEDRYALFRAGAVLSRRDVLSVVPAADRVKYQDRRARGVKSAAKAGIAIGESTSFEPFWTVLEENLKGRFGVNPVHSLAEVTLLHSRFSDAIRLFEAKLGDEVVAGCVIFETPTVAHVQYISANETGKRAHALDALFHHLISDVYRDKRFFDFGISNEDEGRSLNMGLVEQKEGFGARSVVHDYYTLAI